MGRGVERSHRVLTLRGVVGAGACAHRPQLPPEMNDGTWDAESERPGFKALLYLLLLLQGTKNLNFGLNFPVCKMGQ